jgi:hypothetical protein
MMTSTPPVPATCRDNSMSKGEAAMGPVYIDLNGNLCDDLSAKPHETKAAADSGAKARRNQARRWMVCITTPR